jgi:YD repeat-containing protein
VIYRTYGWVAPQGAVLTKPNGSSGGLQATTIGGKTYLAGQDQPAGAGCTASSSAQTYDANGNVASKNDFNGTRSCYASDLTRNLQVASVLGLTQSQDCAAVTQVNAALPSGARKTSTQWHPDWSLPSKVAEPGQITTSIYNGQPDPLNGNAIASCAPGAAPLLDGKPIAVLCKRVVQSTTDTDGHLGFNASLQSGVVNRVSTWTYNEYGQVLTAKGPRTAVNDTTTYAYYTDTTADHTIGDLKTFTNAAGKVTTYDKYNKLGQLLQSTDANGNVTVNTYDTRQHLLTSSVAGETTTYAYDPVGQLVQVTQADGSWVVYEYDDAHRQKAVKDNLGNRIESQLDSAGSKTGESVKDPTGGLKRNLSRVLDALGRIQQSTGGVE